MPKRYRCGDAVPADFVLPPETALTQITGAAALNTLLIRVLFAVNAFDVLGLNPQGFTDLAIESQYFTMIGVVHPCSVFKVLIDKELYDTVMPFAWTAYYRMQFARKTLFRQLEQSLLTHVNFAIVQTGRRYASARY